MLNRRARWQSLFMSPGVSVIIAALGALLMIVFSPYWYITVPLSAAVVVAVILEIKSQMLFRGPNFPFAAFFMLLQGSMAQTPGGCAIAALATLALITGFRSYLRRDFRHSIFLLFLCCGIGALWLRGFALLAVAIYFTFFAVRAMSMRGTVAALLGFITPAILLTASGIVDPMATIELYAAPWEFMPQAYDVWVRAAKIIATGSVAILASLGVFLTAYGYPAKPRALNMSVFVLTAVALLMPVVDFGQAVDYAPLINLCAAYQLTHLVATRRFGWIMAIVTWGVCAGIFFL